MDGNSKAALNIWCSKKKLNYTYDFDGPDDGQFKCLIQINTIDYTATGFAGNKKTASSNAAFDMLNYLAQKHYINEIDYSLPYFKRLKCFEQLSFRDKLFDDSEINANNSQNSHNSVRNCNKNKQPNQKNEPAPEASHFWSPDSKQNTRQVNVILASPPNKPPSSRPLLPTPSSYQPPALRQLDFSHYNVPDYQQNDSYYPLLNNYNDYSYNNSNNNYPPPERHQEPRFVTRCVKKRKLDIISESPEILGNFTLDNAKHQLNIFFQVNKIKADYVYDSFGPPHSTFFTASIQFCVWKNKKVYFAKEEGPSKQESSRICALAALHQLFKDGLVGCLEPDAPSKRKLMKMSLIYTLNVTQSLKSSLITTYNIVQSYNQYAQAFQHLNDAPKPIKSENSFLYWCPPLENYNSWTNTNLDGTVFANKSMQDINVTLANEFPNMIKSAKFKNILVSRMKLPIWEHKETLINMIHNNRIIIIKGSNGCGKTTQVPQFILDFYIKSGNGSNCNIIVTQPRRFSTISISERVAYERTEELKELKSSVGYSVRFDHIYPRPYGSILFCTAGHLLRRMQGGLKGISHLIIDEVHERDINTDLLLIIVHDLIKLELDIRVIIMSATLDVTHFQRYFNNCGIIEIDSSLFPVNRYYLEDTIEMIKWKPRLEELSYMEDHVGVNMAAEFDCPKSYSHTTIEVMQNLKEGVICIELVVALLEYIHSLTITGSVLIFLPGWNSIFSLLTYLKRHYIFGNENQFMLLPLHSQLSHKDNNQIFQHCVQRKIILSTNIAETSITIDDVVFVIDTCLIKRKIYCPQTNVTDFVIDWVSKSNIQQRQGRAGRVRSGYFFVLCSKKRYESLEEFKKPEILVSSLVETSLLIKYLGFGSVEEFLRRSLDQPSTKSVEEAMKTLQTIHAFDQDNELTPLGTILAKLPIDPRIGRMVIQSILLGVSSPITTIAAASSISFELFDNADLDLLLQTLTHLDQDRYSDHLIFFKVYDMCETSVQTYNQYRCINMNAILVIQNARRQLVEILKKCGFDEDLFRNKYNYSSDEFDVIAGLLVTAFYPNVCMHKKARHVLTNEERIGLIHKTSVFYSHIVNQKISRSTKLKSPVLVYSKKTSNKNLISSKHITMVSFLQLLLFGIRKFEFPPDAAETLLLDGWIEIKIDPQVFDCIWQIKTEFESIMTRLCTNTEYLKKLTQIDNTVLDSVRNICLFDNLTVDITVKST